MKNQRFRYLLVFAAFFVSVGLHWGLLAQKKALSYQDIMRFKAIRNPAISESGQWVGYSVQPDRGDGEAVIQHVREARAYTIPRGQGPIFSRDGAWAAATVQPEATAAAKIKKPKPQPGMALVDLGAGKTREFDNVENFVFSKNSRWLAVHFRTKEEIPDKSETSEKKSDDTKEATQPKKIGTTLLLLRLESEEEIPIPHVAEFAFDEASRILTFAVAAPDGKSNGLYVIDLEKQDLPRKILMQKEMAQISQLTWSEKVGRLAFITATMPTDGPADQDASLWIWDTEDDKLMQIVSDEQAPAGWYFPEKNDLSWSRDGLRLFFGFKPADHREQVKAPEDPEEKEVDLLDVDRILADSEVDVWHWNDPFINPQQKIMWPRIKDRTYLAVYHWDSRRIVTLADEDMPQVETNDNPDVALGTLDAPYRKMITWYGSLSDLYLVNLVQGTRTKIITALEDRSSLSPEGGFVVYYKDRHWYLYNRSSQETRNLTESLEIPFFDEDHDYPQAVPSYGTAGWLKNDSAVLIYDKYDVWKFPTSQGQPVNLTGGTGRASGQTFRVIHLDRDKTYFEPTESLLLSTYHQHAKNWGFSQCRVNETGITPLREEKKKFHFLAKAKNADMVLYTRESYSEFPDLWISSTSFESPRKISDVNPQIKEFAWGTAELVEWRSVDGIPLQGVLIKPGNYDPQQKYPVLVYYYRFFSQRLYEFNQTVINHRPHFPFYASHGYAVFLPDIRFDVGLPGYSATKCLVPGIQKLIDMGIADPDAIGLHGHSWSGYQTAFVITQTDIFKCAVAGAPVSNMTSAYSGIRWESGMARQFQYEQSQSRIGATLWERRDLYIDNSPVFFADRIHTPLLIIFGDEDGAVPWYQGIELYLAMRRLGKDCVFLQYRGEPHHPQKYPNKLDWFKKMKEYFDHYLKGQPGPDWITEGVPYKEK